MTSLDDGDKTGTQGTGAALSSPPNFTETHESQSHQHPSGREGIHDLESGKLNGDVTVTAARNPTRTATDNKNDIAVCDENSTGVTYKACAEALLKLSLQAELRKESFCCGLYGPWGGGKGIYIMSSLGRL